MIEETDYLNISDFARLRGAYDLLRAASTFVDEEWSPIDEEKFLIVMRNLDDIIQDIYLWLDDERSENKE